MKSTGEVEFRRLMTEHITRLAAQGFTPTFQLDVQSAVVIVKQLQLARLHPVNKKECAPVALAITDAFIDRLIETLDERSPGIGALLRDPGYDVLRAPGSEVTFCNWCDDPRHPSPAHHPNGQAEHV